MPRRSPFVTPSFRGSLLIIFLWLAFSPSHAQVDRGTAPPFGSRNQPGIDGERGRENAEIVERLKRSRERERQRRIVDDANRLVELTSRYRKALQEHPTATPENQKLLADIEKLAREVKDRMKGM